MSILALDTEKQLQRALQYLPIFWTKVEKTDNCWIWKGSRDKDGRARVCYGTKQKGEKRTYAAARYLWFCLKKEWPGELCVLHKCDNVLCVNPDHLFLGTKDDNNKDRAEKGRSAPMYGEFNGNRKLSEEQAREVKYSKDSARIQAKKHGISESTVYYIRSGKLWGHL